MELLNLIGGTHMPATTEKWIDLIDPSTGKVYGRLPRSGAPEVENAVDAASKAFPEWSSLGADKRAECIDKLADFISENAAMLA
jgi:acyl-CoA reductase-like NAD-dependent aldehyde dehydrogenase